MAGELKLNVSVAVACPSCGASPKQSQVEAIVNGHGRILTCDQCGKGDDLRVWFNRVLRVWA